MSTILAVYAADPGFPATDQNPAAVRYKMGNLFVDATGGQPSQQELAAATATEPPIPAIDTGADLPANFTGQIAQSVASLRQYLNNDAPTVVQNAAALKVLIRLVLFMARRTLR